MSVNIYAVARGYQTGIMRTYDEWRRATVGYPKCSSRSFDPSEESEAKAWLIHEKRQLALLDAHATRRRRRRNGAALPTTLPAPTSQSTSVQGGSFTPTVASSPPSTSTTVASSPPSTSTTVASSPPSTSTTVASSPPSTSTTVASGLPSTSTTVASGLPSTSTTVASGLPSTSTAEPSPDQRAIAGILAALSALSPDTLRILREHVSQVDSDNATESEN
ncbi:hypothetical protein F5Y10DRAFT_269979 [Nemania abortiva]|nr:hypothetical protein F5Y10DRAFT_269979 [Nemania abortiva]